MNSDLKQTALSYLGHNLSVIPTGTDKLPAVKEWKQFQSSTIKKEEIGLYFTSATSLAIICGKVSGGVEAIDIDCKYDLYGNLFADFVQLVKELGGEEILKKVVIEKTPTNGWHLIYRCSVIAGNQKLASRETTAEERLKNPKEKVKVLIETRGEGGYFVCAPSPGYQIKQHDFSAIPEITPEERTILLDASRALNTYVQETYHREPAPQDNTHALSPFEDYDSRADVVELLEKHGWSEVRRNSSKATLKRPGASDTKYSGYYHFDKKWLTVFSTSTEFENQKAYKPYAVFAVLECGGDFKAAAKKLLSMGYGSYKNGTDKETSQQQEAKDPIPLTTGMSMNEALKIAQSLPKMKRLFSTLLLENTLNIWGGDNGVGKSILTFALAEHLARGWKFLGFENECEPVKILLYDFELTLQGLLKRYSDAELRNPYQFSPNLYRYDFNPDFCDFSKNYDDQLFADIRGNVVKLGAKVLIIDNLSALKSKSNSDGDIALDLMNRLNRLKKELGITIIVLTHITKLPMGVAVEKNHIAGSKHIQNLCDGILAVASSSQGGERIYIKELKNRYEQQQYALENVIVCERVKKDNFLTIEFLEFDVECNHLARETERTNAEDPRSKAIQLRDAGKSIGEIATELKKSKSTIHDWIKSVRSFENPRETERTNDTEATTPTNESIVRSFEVSSKSERTNGKKPNIKSSTPVRSPNERTNDAYAQVVELAKEVLGQFESRSKPKIIQAIKLAREIDEEEADSLLQSMLDHALIAPIGENDFYLAESVPY